MKVDDEGKEYGTRHGIFWGRKPWMVTKKKLDGDDKYDGTRHDIFGKNAIDSGDKEDG